MPLLAAVSDFPFELILLLVAAIIGGLNKILEASRSVRKKSLEEQKGREQPTGVELVEAPARRPRKRQPERAEDEVQVPLPEYGVPLPMPEALVPKCEILRVVPPRRPRPPKPLLQLGTEPVPLPLPIVSRRRTPAALPRVVPPRARALGLGDPKRLREAIVLREVLGPPVALRGRRPR